MRQARAVQLQGGLIVQAIVGERWVWVLRRWGRTGTAGSTRGNRGLCADDGCRAVEFAEMGERDLEGRMLAMKPGSEVR